MTTNCVDGIGKREVSLTEPTQWLHTAPVPHLSHAIGVDVIQADPKCTTWANNDFVQKTLATFQRQLHGELAVQWQSAIDNACVRAGLESPLEAAFLAAWEMYEVVGGNRGTHLRFYLKAQVPVDSYRLDFQILIHGDEKGDYRRRFPKLCVELDGHDFHEKTKEQVADRNERDRYLMTRGWKVIRFSGSEFYRDPFGCVMSAWAFADDAVGRLMIEDWRREEAEA